MGIRPVFILNASALLLILLSACDRPPARRAGILFVRLAELEIDPAQLEQYKSALKEEIESSIRLEPGVLGLYAVSLKNDQASIRIFEMYTDVQAYSAHLKTPHFLRYKNATQNMVKSLKLLETDPILLGGTNVRR